MQGSPVGLAGTQQSGTVEPIKDTPEASRSLSSERLHDTIDDSASKVVQPEDFKHVDFAAASYTQSDIEEFKSFFMGMKLPPQETSTDELRAAGWEGPNPWATCVLENYVINSQPYAYRLRPPSYGCRSQIAD